MFLPFVVFWGFFFLSCNNLPLFHFNVFKFFITVLKHNQRGDRKIGKKIVSWKKKKSLTSKVGLPKEKMVSFNLNVIFFFFFLEKVCSK